MDPVETPSEENVEHPLYVFKICVYFRESPKIRRNVTDPENYLRILIPDRAAKFWPFIHSDLLYACLIKENGAVLIKISDKPIGDILVKRVNQLSWKILVPVTELGNVEEFSKSYKTVVYEIDNEGCVVFNTKMVKSGVRYRSTTMRMRNKILNRNYYSLFGKRAREKRKPGNRKSKSKKETSSFNIKEKKFPLKRIEDAISFLREDRWVVYRKDKNFYMVGSILMTGEDLVDFANKILSKKIGGLQQQEVASEHDNETVS